MVVLSLAREVRWGIRSYSSVRVGGCAPLEIFGASCSGFDSATLHQCRLWPRQHRSGLAQAVGHHPVSALLPKFSADVAGIHQTGYTAYAPIGLASTHTVLCLARRQPPLIAHNSLSIYTRD